MSIHVGSSEIKEIFYGSTRIRAAYLGSSLLWQYDSAAPTLAVTAPTGTSSSSPTYYQSDSAASYTVKGTVTDADSGVKSVTVNGKEATISGTAWSCTLTALATNTTHTITITAEDNAGNTVTVNRYLRVETSAQYAARTGILYNAGKAYMGYTTYTSAGTVTFGSSAITLAANTNNAVETQPCAAIYFNALNTSGYNYTKLNIAYTMASGSDALTKTRCGVLSAPGMATGSTSRVFANALAATESGAGTYTKSLNWTSGSYAAVAMCPRTNTGGTVIISKIWLS